MTLFKKFSLFVIFALSVFSTLSVHSVSLSELNILGVNCIFPDSQTVIQGDPYNRRGCRDGGGLSFIDNAVDFLAGLAPAVAVLSIMWGGYLYYISALNKTVVGRGFEAIRAGVIGLAITLIFPAIYRIVNILYGAETSRSFFSRLAYALTQSLLLPVFQVGTYLAGAFAVVTLVYGGYKFLQGDVEDGRKSIINALIGLAVVFGSVVIVALLQNVIIPALT